MLFGKLYYNLNIAFIYNINSSYEVEHSLNSCYFSKTYFLLMGGNLWQLELRGSTFCKFKLFMRKDLLCV